VTPVNAEPVEISTTFTLRVLVVATVAGVVTKIICACPPVEDVGVTLRKAVL
jgi:hypothetical protein